MAGFSLFGPKLSEEEQAAIQKQIDLKEKEVMHYLTANIGSNSWINWYYSWWEPSEHNLAKSLTELTNLYSKQGGVNPNKKYKAELLKIVQAQCDIYPHDTKLPIIKNYLESNSSKSGQITKAESSDSYVVKQLIKKLHILEPDVFQILENEERAISTMERAHLLPGILRETSINLGFTSRERTRRNYENEADDKEVIKRALNEVLNNEISWYEFCEIRAIRKDQSGYKKEISSLEVDGSPFKHIARLHKELQYAKSTTEQAELTTISKIEAQLRTLELTNNMSDPSKTIYATNKAILDQIDKLRIHERKSQGKKRGSVLSYISDMGVASSLAETLSRLKELVINKKLHDKIEHIKSKLNPSAPAFGKI